MIRKETDMLIPIHSPARGKLRVIGLASGSGNTLWKALEMQRQMEDMPEGCPFEIVGIFTDNPAAKCVSTARELGIPCKSVDIRQFYAKRGKPIKDREVRREYDQQILDAVRGWGAELILLAGYVWATTDQLLSEYTVINVHPADLRAMKDGRRAYAGANGVGRTLKAREPAIAATSHLATSQLDGGPLLMVSESVPIDYGICEKEMLERRCLKLVNEQNRLVGARTLLEIAQGNYAMDESGAFYFKGEAIPQGVKIDRWCENQPLFLRHTRKLLYPDSVAVIGASQKTSIGNAVVRNLLRDQFPGPIYAVNTRGEDVDGAPGYRNILDIPGPVDLAILTVPSGAVLEVAEACGQKGVSALICITAGFGELGGEGVAVQKALLGIVHKYNMRMIGPNCMGLLNSSAHLNANMLANAIVPGNVALVTQSGAIGASMLDYAESLGIGFSSIVSLGNQADVTVCDLLPFLEEDANTRVILMYLESIPEPVRFWQYASGMKTPIVLLKSGVTAAGAAAAGSHTGSLTGNDAIVGALIEKAGVIRAESLEDCFLHAVALSHMGTLKGRRVLLLTNAGGPGILISDRLNQEGFEMPRPSAELRERLSAVLLKKASTNNPVDVVAPAPPEHYAAAAQAVMESGEYDAMILCCIPPATVDTGAIAYALIPLLQSAPIPVVTNFFGPTLGAGGRRELLAAGIPVSEYPEQTVDMLRALLPREAYAGGEETGVPGQTVRRARALLADVKPGEYVPAERVYELLHLFGIPAAGCRLLVDPAQVDELTLQYPVAAKIEHPEIVHKSDVGGVRTDIEDAAGLKKTVAAFLEKFQGARGVLVQEMVPAGLELIVGAVGDKCAGQAVMVGLGGVWVEVIRDVKFGYLPLNRRGAAHMTSRLKIDKLLAGFRGAEGVEKEKLYDLLERTSAMALALPEIAEMDMNPVLYDAVRKRFVAVDARMRKA